MKIFYIISLLIFTQQLTACSTPEERAAEIKQQKAEQKIARQKYIAKLSNKCKEYGFKPATPEFSQCLQTAEQQDTLERSVYLQQQQLNQNKPNPFQSMMDADKNTRALFKQ